VTADRVDEDGQICPNDDVGATDRSGRDLELQGADRSVAAQSPTLDYEPSRRDVLRAAGAAGATAAIGTPALAQNETNTTAGDDISCIRCGPTDADLSDILDPLFYNSGKTFAWLSPWHSLGGEDAATDEYEYQQRLAIYNQAYNWMQFTERQLTGVENQGDLYSRSAMEDGLVELFYQADQGAASADAITAAKDVVRDQWNSIIDQYFQHFQQTALAVKKWYNHLTTINTDLQDSTSQSYSMVAYSPFTGTLQAIEDMATGTMGGESGMDNNADFPFQTTLKAGTEVEYDAFQVRNPGSPFFWLSLPTDMSDVARNADHLTESSRADLTYQLWSHAENTAWTYDAWDPANNEGESYEDPHENGDSTEEAILSALRVYPPDPADFDVDPEMVEDVSDHPNAYLLNIPQWHETLSRLNELRQQSLDGIETWANSNYTDVKNNPDQWSLDDMVGPAALQESAKEAKNPAAAALGLHGQGVPTNLENDVLIEFPNATDENGNPIQAPGYLAMLNPPDGGLPVGEVIDPSASEYDGSTIYFSFWNSDLAALPSVDDDGENVSDTNTTNESDDLDGSQTDDYGTYKPIGEPFKILKTAEGTDTVQFEARDVSDPDYDWQTVVENLRKQNQALQDANEETITVVNETGGGGPIIPDGFDLGTGSPLAGLAIIGGAVVAVGAAVSSLLPGN